MKANTVDNIIVFLSLAFASVGFTLDWALGVAGCGAVLLAVLWIKYPPHGA